MSVLNTQTHPTVVSPALWSKSKFYHYQWYFYWSFGDVIHENKSISHHCRKGDLKKKSQQLSLSKLQFYFLKNKDLSEKSMTWGQHYFHFFGASCPNSCMASAIRSNVNNVSTQTHAVKTLHIQVFCFGCWFFFLTFIKIYLHYLHMNCILPTQDGKGLILPEFYDSLNLCQSNTLLHCVTNTIVSALWNMELTSGNNSHHHERISLPHSLLAVWAKIVICWKCIFWNKT